jgi:hypothetical protein
VYELLLAQQAQVLTAKQYVEASKAFWLAWVDLERAVGGGVGVAQAASRAVAPATSPVTATASAQLASGSGESK